MRPIAISLILLIIVLSNCNQSPPIKTGLEGKQIPNCNLLLMDSINRFNTKSIPFGNPIVLILFMPNCPFCRALTQDIVENIKSLSHIRFLILSRFPFDQIKNYYDKYNLKKYSNITVAQDETSYFGNYFDIKGVPYIAIYNSKKQLKQVIIGKVPVSVIQNIANQ